MAPISRITLGLITSLKHDEIFVFGSNEAGNHGRGAALTAKRWGAKRSVANGLSGRTYAIPTKPADVRRVLCLRDISNYVNEFIKFARSRPDLRFLVTEIGCGLAGYGPDDVAPLFAECRGVINVCLPKRFWEVLSK
jgi:hypothetical protein